MKVVLPAEKAKEAAKYREIGDGTQKIVMRLKATTNEKELVRIAGGRDEGEMEEGRRVRTGSGSQERFGRKKRPGRPKGER